MQSYNSGIHIGHGIIGYKWGGTLNVNGNSKVVASITEVTDPGGEPMLGNANLSVISVAPNDRGELDKDQYRLGQWLAL